MLPVHVSQSLIHWVLRTTRSKLTGKNEQQRKTSFLKLLRHCPIDQTTLECSFSIRWLAKQCGLNQTTVRKLIDELLRARLIERVVRGVHFSSLKQPSAVIKRRKWGLPLVTPSRYVLRGDFLCRLLGLVPRKPSRNRYNLIKGWRVTPLGRPAVSHNTQKTKDLKGKGEGFYEKKDRSQYYSAREKGRASTNPGAIPGQNENSSLPKKKNSIQPLPLPALRVPRRGDPPRTDTPFAGFCDFDSTFEPMTGAQHRALHFYDAPHDDTMSKLQAWHILWQCNRAPEVIAFRRRDNDKKTAYRLFGRNSDVLSCLLTGCENLRQAKREAAEMRRLERLGAERQKQWEARHKQLPESPRRQDEARINWIREYYSLSDGRDDKNVLFAEGSCEL